MEVLTRLSSAIAAGVFAVLCMCAQSVPVRADFSEPTARAIHEACVARLLKDGFTQDRAAKDCQCATNVLKKVFDEDQARFFLAGTQRDRETLRRFGQEKGLEWYDKTVKLMSEQSAVVTARCDKR